MILKKIFYTMSAVVLTYSSAFAESKEVATPDYFGLFFVFMLASFIG